MYEVLEHWKQYKEAYKQMDKLLTKLAKKNGVTKL